MRYTILNIANYFLARESMTHKKLQKMCYYAFAWYFALNHGRLFTNNFQAWVHGPVDPGLYSTFRGFGWQSLPQPAEHDIDDPDIISFLELVYESYGEFSGNELEYMTHKEDPWLNARQGLPPYQSSNNPIDEEVMGTYYLKRYEEAQND